MKFLQHTTDHRLYMQGARQMLLQLLNASDILKPYKGKEPLIAEGEKPSHRKEAYWFDFHLLKALRSDNDVLFAFLLGKPLYLKHGVKIVKGKAYKTVEFIVRGEDE